MLFESDRSAAETSESTPPLAPPRSTLLKAMLPVLVSAATRERVGARYAWKAFPPMSVRGKSEPLALFAPIRGETQ